MDVKTIYEHINAGGVFAICALMVTCAIWVGRYLFVLFVDKEKGLVIVWQKAMIESVEMNKESNRVNAECNIRNTGAIDRLSRAVDRQSKLLAFVSRKCNMDLDALGDDSDDDGVREVS